MNANPLPVDDEPGPSHSILECKNGCVYPDLSRFVWDFLRHHPQGCTPEQIAYIGSWAKIAVNDILRDMRLEGFVHRDGHSGLWRFNALPADWDSM